MSCSEAEIYGPIIETLIQPLNKVTKVKKCWSCGCLHSAIASIENNIPKEALCSELNANYITIREHMAPIQYDCKGCKTCYGAIITNAISLLDNAESVTSCTCSCDKVETRLGWPPLPGAYSVLRYQAPVAVCTLTNKELSSSIASINAQSDISIVGSLQTENLGIERIITNILANPNIRFLILCGTDSQQNIGHLPGRSFTALKNWGVDANGNIIKAPGKRPVLRNIKQEAIEHFLKNVEVIDFIGHSEIIEIIDFAQSLAKKNPGPAEPFETEPLISPLKGYLPELIVPDPAGYFVIFMDRDRHLLFLEHYQNDGLLDTIIEGKTAAELYIPAIDKGLVSLMDHAAYLGRELTKAEHALFSDTSYIQDAAPQLRH